MVTSEPWITLGLGFEQALQRLSDTTREIHVGTVKEQIVGVLILHLSGPLNGYIQTIAVHPDWCRRGIGTQMVEWAEDHIFRQSPNVFLCVSSFNHRARTLYERLGYQQVGELTNFLVECHSEILMRKTRGPLLSFKPVA
ncbi:MAG: GNAT family N-acetyltransferase [Verrucomicrobia bacterium]|nr:GNAT family N-acetyltransferase [Verrucomicrobiota bacterium]